MPMLKDGETMHKVVLLGPRGAATHLLEHRPHEWMAENWKRADGQGEVGEPPMDWASFNEPFRVDGAPHRAYFFGHGIASADFERLGPQTKAAMFKRMDHLVLVLDGSERGGLAGSIGDDLGDTLPAITAVGIHGSSASAADLGGRKVVPVTLLADAGIPAWMRDFLPRLASTLAPAEAQPAGSAAVIGSMVSANLERVQFAGLTEQWEILLSPIWEPGPTGAAVRRAFLAPRSMRAHYFEGAALEVLRSPNLGAIVAAMAQHADARHPIADLKDLYCDPEAPFVEVSKVWTSELGALSLLLADVARRARVGATVQQLLAHELSPEQSEALRGIEEDFMAAMGNAPVDLLLKATRDLAGVQRRPWRKSR